MATTSGNGTNGSGAAAGYGALQTATLASAGEGDRLVNALWAKVLARPLPNIQDPGAFFGALDKKYERVVTDLYGMSEVRVRSTLVPGAVAGYGTAQTALRGTVAKSVSQKVVECVAIVNSFANLPVECCSDPARSRALIPTILDDLQRLPKLIDFKDGLDRVRQVIVNIGLNEKGEVVPGRRLAELRDIYGLGAGQAWTIEQTDAGTGFTDLTWKLREIVMVTSVSTGTDLYTIKAAFQGTAFRIQQLRNEFAQCGVSPASFTLPIKEKDGRTKDGITFEEVLAGLEYQTSPTLVEGGVLAIKDHQSELETAVTLLGRARVKPHIQVDAKNGAAKTDKDPAAPTVDADDACLPQCYVSAGRDIEALYCTAKDCIELVEKLRVGPPPTCDISIAYEVEDAVAVELRGHIPEVRELVLVREKAKPVVARSHHRSSSGDYVQAMFDRDKMTGPVSGYQIKVQTRTGHSESFPIRRAVGLR